MDLNTITIAQFMAYFLRDFPYLPVYSGATSYKVDDIIYYETDESFYKCILASLGNLPTNVTYWEAYSDDIENYVLDADITKAFAEAEMVLNQSLFSSDANVTLGYLYVTAHFVSNDLRVAQQGILSTGTFPIKKRKVGNVHEEYEIPTAWVNSPIFSFYTKTGYGLKYLNMVMPKIVGHTAVLAGQTLPNWNVENSLQSLSGDS